MRTRCLDDLQVFDYAEQRLGEAERIEVQYHLDACSECRNLVLKLVEIQHGP